MIFTREEMTFQIKVHHGNTGAIPSVYLPNRELNNEGPERVYSKDQGCGDSV
jgi:hypothetical protein